MTFEDQHPDLTSGSADKGEMAEPKDLPRFLVAVGRYEEYLQSLVFEGDAMQRYQQFADLIKASNGLMAAAQTYDFTLSYPGLEGTQAVVVAGQNLGGKLSDPSIPAEVRSIYTELYSEDLHAQGFMPHE